MSQKRYSSEEAYRILSLSVESDGDDSLTESASEYEPVESSGTLTASSDEGEVVPAKVRRTRPQVADVHEMQEMQQVPGTSADLGFGEASTSSAVLVHTSTAVDPGEVASTSSAVQAGRVASTVIPPQPPRRRRQARRAHSAIPEVLANPDWQPPSTAAPVIPPFTAQAGVQVETANLGSALDFFELFFTEDLCELIVAQSNLYATQFIAANPNSYLARPFQWKPITVSEFKTFLGLLLNMGITKKNELRSYWSTDPIHHMPVFSAAMPRTRFETIMRFMHFSDNSTSRPRSHPNYDRLHKIRPLIDHLSQKFADIYKPQKNICVDESLIHFTGRLGIKQYIPSKRARYGVKLYKLCERATGYTFKFRIYEGKDSQLEPPGCPDYLGSSGKIVWDLLTPLFHKGHHLYVDNFYSSVPLFRHLFLQGTLCCGTVRHNRKGFPQRLVNTRLRRGDKACLKNEELLAVKWRDKRDVYMLSTIHADTTIQINSSSGVIEKPTSIHDYNLFMGGVDYNDQMMKPYLASRRTRYWYKKVAVYLFQLALYNSYVIYKSAGNTGSLLKFQEAIIAALLFPEGAAAQPHCPDAVSRLHERHFPDVLSPTPTQRAPQKRCRVCTKNGIRRETRYFCPDCPGEPGLCIKDCFKRFHTVVRY